MVLFVINPMWRHSTQGLYSLVFNTILHYDHLDARGVSAEETEGSDRERRGPRGEDH